MFDELIRRWWIVALRGIAAVLFGVAVFMAPDRTLLLLASLFGLFALADGVFTMGAGLSLNWLTLFLEGVVGAVIGGVALVYPPAVELGFVHLIAVWAFVTGALELGGAFRLWRVASGPMVNAEWLLAASGALSVAFGALLMMEAGTLTLMVGSYAIASGVLLLALALNVRTWQPALPPAAAA